MFLKLVFLKKSVGLYWINSFSNDSLFYLSNYLHVRRPLCVRERTIYSMHIERITEDEDTTHHYQLQLKTEAGTYPFNMYFQLRMKSFSNNVFYLTPLDRLHLFLLDEILPLPWIFYIKGRRP